MVTQAELDAANSFISGESKTLVLNGKDYTTPESRQIKTDFQQKSGDYFGADTTRQEQPVIETKTFGLPSEKVYGMSTKDYGLVTEQGYTPDQPERYNFNLNAPIIRKKEEKVAVQFGTLQPNKQYSYEEELAARQEAQKIAEKEYETDIKKFQDKTGNVDYDPKLTEDITTFEKKYSSYLTNEGYSGLPEEASKELDYLTARSDIQSKKVDIYNKELTNFQKKYKDYLELGRLKSGVYETTKQGYDTAQMEFLTTKSEMGFRQERAAKEGITKIEAQLYELQNKEAPEYNLATRENPFVKLKEGNIIATTADIIAAPVDMIVSPSGLYNAIPILPDVESGYKKFKETMGTNLDKTFETLNIGYFETAPGRQFEKDTFALSKGIKKYGDDVIFAGINAIMPAKEGTKTYQSQQMFSQKVAGQIAAVPAWIGKRPTETLAITSAVAAIAFAPSLAKGLGSKSLAEGGIRFNKMLTMSGKGLIAYGGAIDIGSSFGGATTSKESLNLALQIGEKDLSSGLKLGVGLYEEQYYGDKPIRSNIRSYLPGANIFMRQQDLINKGVFDYLDYKGYNLTTDQKGLLSNYLKHRIIGERVGAVAGLVTSEVSSELTGRTLTRQLSTKITPELLKQAPSKVYWTTFKDVAPNIAAAAPVEIFTSQAGQAMTTYSELEPTNLLIQLATVTPAATAIGGYIAGRSMKQQAIKGIGKDKPGFVEFAADISDLPEVPGDITANWIESGQQYIKQQTYKMKVKTYQDITAMNQPTKFNFESDQIVDVTAKESINVKEKQKTSSPINIKEMTTVSMPVQNKQNMFVTTSIKTMFPETTKYNIVSKQQTPIDVMSSINIPLNVKTKTTIPNFAKYNLVFQNKIPSNLQIYTPLKTQTTIKQPTNIKQTVKNQVNVPITIPDKFIPPFIPSFNFDMSGFGMSGKRKKPKSRYVPSFDAIILGITAKKGKYKQQVFTGLETRPILLG